MRTEQQFCKCCDQLRPFEKRTANHVLHLLLSIVTLGWWVLVWFFVTLAARGQPGRCRSCGSEFVPKDREMSPIAALTILATILALLIAVGFF
jgi:hypothetical protein